MRTKMRARSKSCSDSKREMVVGTTQAPEMTHPSKVLNTYAKSMDWNDCPVVHKPEMGRIHMTKPTYLGSDTLHMGEAVYYGKTNLG